MKEITNSVPYEDKRIFKDWKVKEYKISKRFADYIYKELRKKEQK